ncbi:hypothetical protein [Nonomuraea rhodomycinica]|uniref:Uncharacterized protein n=1 Tax=Nonomuraea rhodomycinica TaxID=1712872 RepID=A0A7Y6MC34_9ACTN|nr:hypothetical protein [Nonomuraea rhodomycinica]NUW41480.1 hypothetical protein [Nonomuraea rhodomycinica]
MARERERRRPGAVGAGGQRQPDGRGGGRHLAREQGPDAFVRHWARRPPVGDPMVAGHGRLVLVTEAVHSLTRRGVAATVNAVAHGMGIDHRSHGLDA